MIRSLLPTRRRLRLNPPAKFYFPCKQSVRGALLIFLPPLDCSCSGGSCFLSTSTDGPWRRRRLSTVCSSYHSFTAAASRLPLLYEFLDSIALSRQRVAFRLISSNFLLPQLSLCLLGESCCSFSTSVGQNFYSSRKGDFFIIRTLGD